MHCDSGCDCYNFTVCSNNNENVIYIHLFRWLNKNVVLLESNTESYTTLINFIEQKFDLIQHKCFLFSNYLVIGHSI